DIVVPANGLQTVRAPRPQRPENALLARQAGDPHIEEAAHNRAKDKQVDQDQDDRAPVQEEGEHAARISRATAAGDRPAVTAGRSAQARYSGPRPRCSSAISSIPPTVSAGRRSALDRSPLMRSHMVSTLAINHTTVPVCFKCRRLDSRSTTPPPV